MVGITQVPGVWAQVRLIAGLRWRIMRNGLRRKNSQSDLLGTLFLVVLGAVIIAGTSFGSFFGAYQIVSLGRVSWLTLLFWAVFIFWQLFPVFTAGFGAGFEFRNLLRFPFSPRAFYLIGLTYGLADFSAIAGFCALFAMTIGVAVANRNLLPVMLIVCGLFVFMNVTLERMIGSWLERILARRRARELFFALFILVAVSVQFISPLLQHYGKAVQPWVRQLLPYLSLFPASLAGDAVLGAYAGQIGETLRGEAGVAAYGLLFSVLLWVRLSAQYRGEELSETAAPVRVKSRAAVKPSVGRDNLRLLSPQVAAVVRKEFRYLTRNSFAFFLLIMPLVFVLVFATQFSGSHPVVSKHPLSPDLFFPGMMGYLILILTSPAYNSFAFDGRGIQTYFTSPLSFREVFLGKNLIQVAISVFELTLSIAMFSYVVGLPSPPVFAATLAAIVFVLSGQLAIANWSSLNFPRKLNFGQMRGQRQSAMASLVALGTQVVFGAICAPVLLAGRWVGNPWLPAEIFIFLAALAVVGYSSSLEPLAQLAEKKKESLIEALCR